MREYIWHVSVDDEKKEPFRIGYFGENIITEVEFDISPWVERFGDGEALVTIQRTHGEEPYYAVDVTREGNRLVWKPDSIDTAIKTNSAQCELRYYVGEKIAKSGIWSFSVGAALGDAGEVPDAYESYLDRMGELAARTQENAQSAAASAEAADGAASDARQSAGAAAESAVDAAESAEASGTARDASRRWAELAQEGAENAGYFYLEGREDGHLYMIRSANAPPDITFRDVNGRLVAVYG